MGEVFAFILGVSPILAFVILLVYRAGRNDMRQEIQEREDAQMAEADKIMRDDRSVDDVADRLHDGRF